MSRRQHPRHVWEARNPRVGGYVCIRCGMLRRVRGADWMHEFNGREIGPRCGQCPTSPKVQP